MPDHKSELLIVIKWEGLHAVRTMRSFAATFLASWGHCSAEHVLVVKKSPGYLV
jgi:hypothetical protein